MANISNSSGINGAYSTTDGQQPPNGASNANSQATDVPKDEVGWYFVEQYYTTLSRSPEKLHLFYNRRSQFVSGQETDKVPVCVGQRSINEKIKELDFQDCKVRVTNVDSQASDTNIVIQVIGEISNKSQPHKKFVQTFVLAAQTNGYFVLNDIFRYLLEEEDDVEQEPEQEPEQERERVTEEQQTVVPLENGNQEAGPEGKILERKTLPSSTDPEAVEEAAKVVDREIEAKLIKEDVAPETSEVLANGAVAAEDDQSAAGSTTAEETTEQATSHLAVEKPKDPEPTPASSPLKQTASTVQAPIPAAVPKPSAPKTWANLAAAANRVATPVAPATTANQTRAPATSTAGKSQAAAPTAAPSLPAAATTQTPTTSAAEKRDESPSSAQNDEWTAVGGTHARQQSRQVNPQQDVPHNRAYIKNVYEGVDGKELRTHLEQFGEITYFDVARQKNCAFVDFKTAEGYNAAVSANPHVLGNERLFVEERRPRPVGQFGGQRGQFQGGRGGRGGANQGAPRGNLQTNRGGATSQPRGGRGGIVTPRGGRGGAQAA